MTIELSDVRGEIEAYNLVDYNGRMKNEFSKWRVISAVQKLIRRGEAKDAIRYAQALARIEPNYLFFRLAVIAVEDIGIADTDAAMRVLIALRNRVAREYGDILTASYLVETLANAAKDRNACDLLVAVDWTPKDWDAQEFSEGSYLDWQEILTDESEHYLKRATAAWLIAGTRKHKSPTLPPVYGDPERLLNIYETMGVPDDILKVSRLGFALQREGHPIMLGLTYLLTKQLGTTGEIADDNNLTPIITARGLPSIALDMHTREGKAALKRFSMENGELRQLFKDNPKLDKVRAMGTELFRLEGHQCRNRLQSGLLEKLNKDVPDAFHISGAGDLALGAEIFAILRENLDLLNEIRGR